MFADSLGVERWFAEAPDNACDVKLFFKLPDSCKSIPPQPVSSCLGGVGGYGRCGIGDSNGLEEVEAGECAIGKPNKKV